MKNYFYSIGYFSYEDSEYIKLTHTKKYSKEQFNDLVINASVEVIKNEDEPEETRYSEIVNEVVNFLVEKYGFKRLQYTAGFSVFGWDKVLDKEDWPQERGELIDRICDKYYENNNKE